MNASFMQKEMHDPEGDRSDRITQDLGASLCNVIIAMNQRSYLVSEHE